MGGDVLCQSEIDQLLFNMGTISKEELRELREMREQASVAYQKRELERQIYLQERQKINWERFYRALQVNRDEQYGVFSSHSSTRLHFFVNGSEEMLSDIEQKNKEEGMGNYKIPNTNITLINYSVCPTCNTIFSFKDLMQYYSNPTPDPIFKKTYEQHRNDTRVHCHVCKAYFMPALVIVDRTPISEVQFLCRIQTVNAIENYYYTNMKIDILTRNRKNIVKNKNNWGRIILNDVLLNELQDKPTLISNLLQYSPTNLALNMMNGTNIQNKDPLFGADYL